MTTLPSRILLAVSLLTLVACASESSDDSRGGRASLQGDAASLTDAMDLCGGQFLCTLFGDPSGPIGPVQTSSFGSDSACVFPELEGQDGELTGYASNGGGLFYDHPATWTQSGKTITLRVSYGGGQTHQLVCTSQR